MFDSKCRLSKDGPLGAIWVAAYCFKKLKKAQVASTDISSSVDKIVQEEFDAVTYRVLAHLLLGVVRIYSKKVDYLFNDCNKVLVQIRDFVVKFNKDNTLVETLCAPSSFASIVLPERFELDSFELDILEDHCGRNVSSHEAITLKDCSWKRKETGRCSMEKGHYEDFLAYQEIWISDHNVDEDMFEAHLPELNMGASTSGSSQKNIHGNKSVGDKFVEQNIDTGPEEEPLETVRLFGDNNKKEGRNRNSPEVRQSDEIGAEETRDGDQGNSFYRQDSDLSKFYDSEKKPVDPGIQSVKDNQIEEQHTQIQILDPALKHQLNEDHCDVGEMEANIEKLQEDRATSEERMNVNIEVEELHDVSSPLGEQLIHPKAVKVSGATSGEDKSQTVSEGNPSSIPLDVTPQSSGPDPSCKMKKKHSLSVSVDATPQSKFPNPSGGAMPEFLVIPTPARSERHQNLKKRKCLFDDDIVIPNKVLKHIIEDASDLVTKRRKVPHTAYAAWKASRVYDLPRSYLEPLIPCSSLLFGSLSCKKRLKTQESADAAECSENCQAEHSFDGKSAGNTDMLVHLHLPNSCAISGSAKTRDDDSRLPQSLPAGGAMDAVETLGNIDVPSATKDDGSVYQVPIAPGTPVQCSSTVRPFESPERQAVFVSGIVIFENQERGSSPSKDEEFFNDLLNKEINTSEADGEFHDTLAEITRSVGQYLHRIFLSRKERNDEEEVNLMQILEQRTRKESTRIFYEILVLKTKGFVDVEQEHPYGNILVRETDKLNQAFELY